MALMCAVLALGCDDSQEARAKKNARDAPSTSLRRCGDFISEDEARILGVDGYRAGKGDKNESRGVVCVMSPVMVSIFMAKQYEVMTSRAKGLKGMKVLDGPRLGKESFWFEAHDSIQVMFVSEKGHYAFAISGPSKEMVEKAAQLSAEGK